MTGCFRSSTACTGTQQSGDTLSAVSRPPRIVIEPYCNRWPSEFSAVQGTLSEALGDLADRIDHIGSTSVPGLSAKDIIDVQISVAELNDPRLEPALHELGCEATDITSDHIPPNSQGSPVDWQKRYFRPPADWRRTHIHVRQTGSANQRYALLFRDYLRQSSSAATAYAQVKVALARLHPDDTQAYYDVKDPVCDLIIEAAEQWAFASNWSA